MIDVRIIPPATATEQNLLVEITENVCNHYCLNSAALPTASVLFEAGAAKVVNGIAVFTITAKITINLPNQCKCRCASTQVFTETFDVAFTATTTNALTLTPGTVIDVAPTNLCCCKAKGVKITTNLSAVIA